MKKLLVSVKFVQNCTFDIYTCFGQARLVYIIYKNEKFLKWGIPILGHLQDSFSDFMLYFFLVRV